MIVVDKVCKYYGSQRAVQDLDFEIGEGECVGFLGLNGAGKSTTLKLLACLLLPTSGRIRIRGLDVVEQPHEIRKLIGYLPDQPPLYAEMTVREYLTFTARLRGLSGSETTRRTAQVLEVCGLAEVADAAIATLSHGYRQRVGIGQAIIHRPALLILDEPIQGLDPVQIVEMRKMIGQLRGDHTILLSTHILSEIEQTCDRILVMHQGHIAAQGTEEVLATRYGAAQALEILVRADAAALREALGRVDVLGEPQVKPGAEPGTLQVRLRVAIGDREQLSRVLVEAGFGLLEMRGVSGGLEAAFLRLSGRHADEGAGASAAA